MIIVLIGKMGTGKTTIANYLISNYFLIIQAISNLWIEQLQSESKCQ